MEAAGPTPAEVAAQASSMGPPPTAVDPTDRQTMLNFISMGNNCEFGFAQRAHGAEPINLWRWANVEVGVAVRAMNARFAEIGNPDHITVDPRPGGRYHPRHAKYPFGWHVWTAPDVTPDEVRWRETKRLPRVAEGLMDDLASGDRIFVVKRSEFPPHVVTLLRDAAQRY